MEKVGTDIFNSVFKGTDKVIFMLCTLVICFIISLWVECTVFLIKYSLNLMFSFDILKFFNVCQASNNSSTQQLVLHLHVNHKARPLCHLSGALRAL